MEVRCLAELRVSQVQLTLHLPHQWNHLISTCENVDLREVSVITADLVLNKVTDCGTHRTGFMFTSHTEHTSSLLVGPHSTLGICGVTQAYLFSPAP